MPLFGRAIRLPLRLIPKGAVLRVFSGGLRGHRWIAGAATHASWLGTYERLTQRVFAERIRPGDVVYDVGANAGFFSLLAAKLTGSAGAVYAFEPLPRNVELIRKHLRLNGVTNVHVQPVAVADRSGVARFGTAASPAMGHLSKEGDVEVQTARLDDLSVPPPSFIKMDIEGAESAALAGGAALLRTARPVILLAEHGYEQHERCGALLASLGYRVEQLVDGTADGNYVVLALPR